MTKQAKHQIVERTSLTFDQVKAFAASKGIVIERTKGGYDYWNKARGASTMGFAHTLKSAVEDFGDFEN